MLRQAEDAIAAGRTAEGTEPHHDGAREAARRSQRRSARDDPRAGSCFASRRSRPSARKRENLAEKCPHPGVKELMERAQAHLRLAREHAESGKLESAIAEMAVARNLYRRIGELCAR